MKQTQKLNALISKIIKEELEESDYMFINKNDPKRTQKKTAASQAGMAVVEDDPTDSSSQKLKTSEAEKVQEPDMEQQPTGTEIAGQVAEIVEKLKAMSEGSEDPKKQKLAAKAMKQMESAKAALEALTAHETMLEEKQREDEEKEGQKHVDKFKKHLTKLVKDPAAVEKIASKLDAKKIADLKKKMNRPELDEEKLARVMLSRSLKEGWVKISKA